jgi:sarcosine oxidase subunit beta
VQKTANTVIIGGGMIGCAMAYELALRGMKDNLSFRSVRNIS